MEGVQRQDSVGNEGFCATLCGGGASGLQEHLNPSSSQPEDTAVGDALKRQASAPPPVGGGDELKGSQQNLCFLYNPINFDSSIQTSELILLNEIDGTMFFGCDNHHTGGPNGTNKTPWTTNPDGTIAPTKQVIRWILTTMMDVTIQLNGMTITLRQAPFRKGPNGEQLYFAPYWPFLKEMFDSSKHRELFDSLFQDNPNGISFDFGMNLEVAISMLPMHIHGKDVDAGLSEAYTSKQPKPSTSFEDHNTSATELATKWFCNPVKEGEFRPRSFPFKDANEVGDPEQEIDGNPTVLQWMSESIPIHTVSRPVELPIGKKTFYCGMPMERLS